MASHEAAQGKPSPTRSRAPGLRSAGAIARTLGVDLSPSELVSIDRIHLQEMASLVVRTAQDRASSATWCDPLFWLPDAGSRDRSQYFAIGNAINFRFWRLARHRMRPVAGVRNGTVFSGAMYMWRSLRLGIERGIPLLEAQFLEHITDQQFDVIFTDDTGVNPLTIGKQDRLKNLRDLGARLRSSWEGEFSNLVDASQGSLSEFAELSRLFRAYDDPLCKLTMLNAILHTQNGIASFDAEPLPAVDYNLMRQLLRQGVLRPTAPLWEKLAHRVRLRQREALELRRTSLVAFVRLSELSALSGPVLDNLWWLNRSNCTDETPVCLDPTTAARCPFLDQCRRHVDIHMPFEKTRYY
jgi:Queuosine salvage protein